MTRWGWFAAASAIVVLLFAIWPAAAESLRTAAAPTPITVDATPIVSNFSMIQPTLLLQFKLEAE